MPVTRYDPKTTIRTTFTCDRCGKVEAVEIEVKDDQTDVPTAPMPDGWKGLQIGHDAIVHDGMTSLFVFCQRACMSTWLGNQVRVIYGEDVIETPKIRRSRKTQAESEPLPMEGVG